MKTNLPEKSKKIKPVITELAKLYRQYYGNRLKYVVLYGSYARGDFDENSDIDVLVVLDHVVSVYSENEILTDIKLDLMIEKEVFISTQPIPIEKYKYSTMPFYKNIKKDGILV